MFDINYETVDTLGTRPDLGTTHGTVVNEQMQHSVVEKCFEHR